MTIDHDTEDFLEMVRSAASATEPRVLAIVIASYIEDYLLRLVQTRLPNLKSKNSETYKKLFSAPGYLSTNAANIEIAHALGVIEDDLKQNLLIVARIRNRFAHNLKIKSFDDGDIPELILKLRISPETKKQLSGNNYMLFRSTATIAAIEIHNKIVAHCHLTENIDRYISITNSNPNQGFSAPKTVNLLIELRRMLSTVSRKK